jgi:hypothetical protein
MTSIKEQVLKATINEAIDILNKKLDTLYNAFFNGDISYMEYEEASMAIKEDIEYLS